MRNALFKKITNFTKMCLFGNTQTLGFMPYYVRVKPNTYVRVVDKCHCSGFCLVRAEQLVHCIHLFLHLYKEKLEFFARQLACYVEEMWSLT